MVKHKARILVFSPWYPPHIGGLENHAEQFNEELAERGYQILTLTPLSSAGGAMQEDVVPNLAIRRFPAFEPIAKYPVPAIWRTEWLRHWRTARRFAPDVVISRTRFFSTTALAWWYHYTSGTPWLHIEHGSNYVQFNRWLPQRLARLYDRLISRWLLRQATVIIANSDASAQFTATLSGRTDVAKIYRGVTHTNLTSIPAAPRPASLRNKVLIVYVGRLIAGKGVPLLLQALAHLSAETTHCYIIGSGPDEPKIKALAKRLGLQSQLTFFSHRPWTETVALLKSADICVNPSYSEGLPTSLIEAALCRTAIVATNVGGTREIITNEKSGLLVPARNQAALSETLQRLVGDQALRQRLAEAAWQTVSQKFKWSTSIEQYENIFAQLTTGYKIPTTGLPDETGRSLDPWQKKS